jgi:hypothetical protein
MRAIAPGRALVAAVLFGLLNLATLPVAAQSPVAGEHEHAAAPQAEGDSPPQHDMEHMGDDQSSMPPARDGSGTSWLPDETPMYAIHGQAGNWTLMAHGNAFLQYLHESGRRGSAQTGSINWAMGMASRPAAGGRLQVRGMFSLEPWTIRGCGYPDLLASGEVCNGETIHDRQHPHDVVMELVAAYDRPLARGVRLQLYGGPAGEPALGPVAFPHRISAMPNALAPITHHWLDATHITYGVITGGVHGSRWKAETSLFNGREPDETRTNLDFGALDSWSGRLWFLPARRWALQVSAGRLKEAEAGHDGGPRIDVTRVTASATYHRAIGPGSIWASTIGWGRNDEPGSASTNALLVETNLTLDERDAWFGRFEVAAKSGHDLAIDRQGLFTVARLQGGYMRYFAEWGGLKPGVGASVSTGIVPASLRSLYGGRFNAGFGLFITLRPGQR